MKKQPGDCPYLISLVDSEIMSVQFYEFHFDKTCVCIKHQKKQAKILNGQELKNTLKRKQKNNSKQKYQITSKKLRWAPAEAVESKE